MENFVSKTELPNEFNVATYLSEWLSEVGVTHVFELVGGMVTVLLDALHSNSRINVVSTHHEQGAGFMAEGFSRFRGTPAVAMATSGPGATNLLTAIASCYFDSVPVIFITGQVNTFEMRTEGRGRQGGFQETDIVAMAKPITKYAWLVRSADEIPEVLSEAYSIATSGRPGPVLIDIPMDVQRASISGLIHPRSQARRAEERGKARAQFLQRLGEAASQAKRPLIIAGGGIRSSGAIHSFRKLVDTWGMPVATTLMGKDAIPGVNELTAGFIGSYGNRWANWAVANSDLLIVLGSRLDVRQTGSDIEGFKSNRTIFHVDIDPTELNNHVPGCDVLEDDLGDFLSAATNFATGHSLNWHSWNNQIAEQRDRWPDTEENLPSKGLNPNEVIRSIESQWENVAAFVTDVGQHQMWAAQSLSLDSFQRFLSSGGMGAMGFGLPASIGVALAAKETPVCLIVGDGGFQCNIQELQTLVRTQAQVRIVVLDNESHGLVRQFQQSYFDGRLYSTRWGYSAPEFCHIATSYGIPSQHVETQLELDRALTSTVTASGPLLIHIKIDPDLNAYPKMAYGQPFGSMEPLVEPKGMEGT